MQCQFEQAVEQICAKHPEFSPEAYHFIQRALEYSSERLKKSPDNPHLSAEELYVGACALALDDYGPLANTVLAHWGIHSGEDIGAVVYNLIEVGIFGKQSKDSQNDFKNLTPMAELLDAPFLPSNNNPNTKNL